MSRATSRAFAWKLLERIGYQGIVFIVQMVLARLLAPEDFGALAIMFVFVNLSNSIVQSGLGVALVQSKNAVNKDFTTVFWISFTLSGILYLAIFCLAPAIAVFYSNDGLVAPLRVLSLVLFINAYNSVQVSYVVRSIEMRKIFVSTLSSAVVSGLVSIGFAINGFGIWALVAQQLVMQLGGTLVLSRQIEWRPALGFDAKRAKELLSFGWKVLASGLLNMGYQDVYDLVVGKAFSTANLGFFSQGKKIPKLVSKILEESIVPVMLSTVSKVQDEAEKVSGALFKGAICCTFVLVPIMSWLVVSADSVIEVVFSEKWLPSVPYFQLFCIAYSAWPIASCVFQCFNAVGRSDRTLKLSIIRTILSIALLCVSLLISSDLIVVCAAFVISLLGTSAVAVLMASRELGFSALSLSFRVMKCYLAAIVSSAITYFIIQSIDLGSMATFVLSFVLVMAMYLGIAKLMKLDGLRLSLDAFYSLIGR